ncbi:MAG: amidohydrolase, partial [Verrucomicrobiaceae bacterium]
TSATLLGMAASSGTLEPGKQASFIVLDANPLEDIRNTEKIRSVWLDGKLQDP